MTSGEALGVLESSTLCWLNPQMQSPAVEGWRHFRFSEEEAEFGQAKSHANWQPEIPAQTPESLYSAALT